MDFDRGSVEDMNSAEAEGEENELPPWARRPEWARSSEEEDTVFPFPPPSPQVLIEGSVNLALPSAWLKRQESQPVSMNTVKSTKPGDDPWVLHNGIPSISTSRRERHSYSSPKLQSVSSQTTAVSQISYETYKQRERWHRSLVTSLFPSNKFEALESVAQEVHTHADNWRERAKCPRCAQASFRLFQELRAAAYRGQCTSALTGLDDRLHENTRHRDTLVAQWINDVNSLSIGGPCGTPLEAHNARVEALRRLQALLERQQAIEDGFPSTAALWAQFAPKTVDRILALTAWYHSTRQLLAIIDHLETCMGVVSYQAAIGAVVAAPRKSCTLFVIKELKRVGLRKLMDRVSHLVKPVMSKVLTDSADANHLALQYSMGLPSFMPLAAYCLRVPLVVLTEALAHFSDNCPKTQLSLLSAEFYLSQLKDALVEARQARVNLESCLAVLQNEDVAAHRLDEQFQTAVGNCFEVYLSMTRLRLAAILSNSEKDTTLAPKLQLALEKEWEFADDMSANVPGGDALVVETYTALVEMLCSGLERHVHSVAALRETAVVDDGRFVTVNQDACREIREMLIEARRRVTKCTDLLKRFGERYKLSCVFDLTSSHTELLDALASAYMLVQNGSGPNIGSSRQVIPGYYLFVPISEGATEIRELLGTRARLNKTGDSKPSPTHLLLLPADQNGASSVVSSTPSTNRASLATMREDDQPPVVTSLNTSLDLSWLGQLTGADSATGSAPDIPASLSLATAIDVPWARMHAPQASAWTGRVFEMPPDHKRIGLSSKDISVGTGLILVTLTREKLVQIRRQISARLKEHLKLSDEEISWKTSTDDAFRRMRAALFGYCKGLTADLARLQAHLLPELLAPERSCPKKYTRCDTIQTAFSTLFELLRTCLPLVDCELETAMRKLLFEVAHEWLSSARECVDPARNVQRWVRRGLDYILLVTKPGITRHLSAEDFDALEVQVDELVNHLASSPSGLNFNTSRGTADSLERFIRESSSQCATTGSLTRLDGDHLPPRRTLAEIDEILAHGFFVSQFGAAQRDRAEQEDGGADDAMVGMVVSEAGTFERATPDEEAEADINMRWQIGKLLGEGSGGEVYMGVNTQTKEVIAIKKVRLSSNASDRKMMIKTVRNEFKLVSEISSAHLVKYFGMEFQKDCYMLFMEYCPNRSLWDCSKGNPLPPLLTRKYTAQIMLGLQTLHSRGIVHRDLKGDNVFLDLNMNAKIGDFGTCARLQDPHKTQYGELNELVGTIVYMAPEVIKRQNKEGHGRKCDIWSLGCVVCEMATGARPYSDRFESVDAKAFQHQLIYFIGSDRLLRPTDPASLDEEGREFLSHCFQREPAARPDLAELLEHPFVKPCVSPQAGLGAFCPCGCQTQEF